jgi:hypothetical protein
LAALTTSPIHRDYESTMFDTTTLYIVAFFIVSSVLGHILLHRIIKTPAQYYRPSQNEGWIDAAVR